MRKNYFLLLMVVFLCSCQTAPPPPPPKPVLEDITVEKTWDMPYIWASINGKRYQFLLDTGSTGFMLTEKMVNEIGLTYSKTNKVQARGITGVAHLKTIKEVALRLDNGIVLNVSDVAVRKDGLGIFPYKFFEVLDVVWDIQNNKLIFKKEIPQSGATTNTAKQ